MSKQDVYPVTEMRKAILNCYELPMDTDLMEAFPILKSLPFWDYKFGVFGKKADEVRQRVIRYFNYFYSPLLTCISAIHLDHKERKVACAVLAGFETDKDGKFDPNVEIMLNGQNEYVNQMLLSFLKISSSDEWATMMWLRDQHYKNMLDNEKIKDGQEQQRVMDALAKLKKMRTEYISNDPSPQLNRSMIDRMTVEELNLSPEAIGKNLEEGLSPLGFSLTA